MKELDYVMGLMSTYGTISPKNGQGEKRWHFKNAHGKSVMTSFTRYPKVITNHYAYHGCIDDHNNKQQDGQTRVWLLSPHGVPVGGQSKFLHSFLSLQKSTCTLYGSIFQG